MFESLKQEALEANLRLHATNLADLTFGNVSVLDRAAGVFAIKPSGVEFTALTRSMIVVVDLEGRVVDGKLRPSSDTSTHRRLYQAFTNTSAIVHTHSRYAVSFAQAGLPIPCLGTTHADYFLGEIPITRPMTDEEISTDYEWQTGNVIVERFLEIDASEVPGVLVNRHGPFVWGQSSITAVETARALEICAQMALQTFLLQPGCEPIDSALLEKHFYRRNGVRTYYGQTNTTKGSEVTG